MKYMIKEKFFFTREVKKQGIQYLVKWNDIGYDQATWEYLDDEDNKDVA